MRLTLRTLLSYLDNVLDEPSRKALEQQIERGENASEWVHRTRDVMRRLKLGAPELHGSGSVDDPNTVAEYLDRTLPEEGVAEFERVCLESDVMLAEVASCHHVLAMVLSETAPIDPDTRKRLHRLQEDLAIAMKSRVEAAHSSPDNATQAATPVAKEPRRQNPETVPSYLRESDSPSWTRWIPALAALLLLAITAGLAFGPGGWFSEPTVIAKPTTEDPTTGEPTTPEEPALANESDQEPTDEVPADASAEAADQVKEVPLVESEPAVAVEDATETDTPETPPEMAGAEEGTDSEVTVAQPDEADGGEGNDEPLSGEPADDAEADTDAIVPDLPGETDETAESVADEPEVVSLLTSLSGPGQFAVFLGPDATWQRLQQGLATSEELRLVCLPTYRSAIEVAEEFVVEMVGLTDVSLNPKTRSVALSHGRIVLSRSAEAAEPITIELVLLEKPDRHVYQIELSPGSVLAVAADRVAEPGHPVLEGSPPLAALAQVIVGPVGYSRTPGDGAKKTEPGALFTRGRFQQMPSDYGNMEWVEKLRVSVPDEYARPMLAQEMAFAAPVLGQALITANEFDLAEVRSLAARCSLALGDAEPIAASFNNETDARYWPVHFVASRQAASRSIAAANQVLRGFVVSHGDNGGAALFELVAGFSPDEVGTTPAEVSLGVVATKIVGADSDSDPGLLESKDLPTRVLASLALDELVIQEGQPYDPLDRKRSRDKSMRLLRQALEREELAPRSF